MVYPTQMTNPPPNEGAPSNRHPPLASEERLEDLFICFASHAQGRVPIAELGRHHPAP